MPRSWHDIQAHADHLLAHPEATPAGLDHLRLAVVELGIAASRVEAKVLEARRLGKSWETISAVLGVSRQAAWQQYSGKETCNG